MSLLSQLIAQGNVGLYKFQDQKTFTWRGVLENNINHIMRPHLTT